MANTQGHLQNVAVPSPVASPTMVDQGQLYKYTNVVKGWQYRWFILKPETGVLEYYLASNADEAKSQRPRGCIHLVGAVVSPSEEDSNTFSVNSANGEAYKLRGINGKGRQEWVDRLRAVAEYHSRSSAQGTTLKQYRDSRPSVPNVPAISNPQQLPPSASHHHHLRHASQGSIREGGASSSAHEQSNATARAQQRVMENTRSIYDAFSAAQVVLVQAEYGHHALAKAIEDLPSAGPGVRCIDPDLLILKATSQATLLCLKQCHSMLQQQQQAASFSQTGVTGGAMMEWLDPFSYSVSWSMPNPSAENTSTILPTSNLSASIITDNDVNIDVKSEDEKTDDDEAMEIEVGSAEEHRTLTIQLLSQLKLGMDLTRVVLPAFILETRSLLEMYADFMCHPDLFVRIQNQGSAESRMLAVVEWYLTGFNFGKKGLSAKKPYNPILGELFFCSWAVDNPTSKGTNCGSEKEDNAGSKQKLKFIAEQVSHHPPVSAFYVESSDKTICLSASVTTKSKFMGMSVAVNIIGEAVISIPEFEEEYVITFPSAYARSMLSTPWVELCGKVGIACSRTGYFASMTFHTKPFYGAKLHRVTAEVKNALGGNICKVQGEWNGGLEFSYANGEIKVIDTSVLTVSGKRLRPPELQSDLESRKVWRHVTTALQDGNMKLATENKHVIEEWQRYKARQWQETGHHFSPRCFEMVGDSWCYKFHLNATRNAHKGSSENNDATFVQ